MRSSSISSQLRLELDWAIIYSLRMVFNKSAKAEPEKELSLSSEKIELLPVLPNTFIAGLTLCYFMEVITHL